MTVGPKEFLVGGVVAGLHCGVEIEGVASMMDQQRSEHHRPATERSALRAARDLLEEVEDGVANWELSPTARYQ